MLREANQAIANSARLQNSITGMGEQIDQFTV